MMLINQKWMLPAIEHFHGNRQHRAVFANSYSDTGINQWADQNDGIELHLYSQGPAFQQKGTD
jgi:regulation of enolase protein 1 (concanavalin A-like superfamily)